MTSIPWPRTAVASLDRPIDDVPWRLTAIPGSPEPFACVRAEAIRTLPSMADRRGGAGTT